MRVLNYVMKCLNLIFLLCLLQFLTSCKHMNNFDFISLTDAQHLHSDENIEGMFSLKPGMDLPYTFAFSSDRGEGSLVFGGFSVQIFDKNDKDGVSYLGEILEQHVEDLNGDGYMDFVLTGKAQLLEEDGRVTQRSVRSVFVFDPVSMSFTNSIADAAIPVDMLD